MTTLTLRRIKDDFIVTGPDIEPAKFTNRREAKDWCTAHYPGSPIKEIGADASERRSRAMPRKGPLRRKSPRTAKSNNPAGADEVNYQNKSLLIFNLCQCRATGVHPRRTFRSYALPKCPTHFQNGRYAQ
jgi:hypothetical protein